MSNDLRLNSFFIIEIAFKHSNKLLKLLLQIISEIYQDEFDIKDMEEEEDDSIYIQNDLLLLFLASNNELEKEKIFESISKVFENLEKNERSLTKYFDFPIYFLNTNSGSSEIEKYSFIQVIKI